MSAAVSIVTRADGLFAFDPNGEPAIVARVHDSEGDLADFVAWFLDRPGAWWLRHRDIAVLGSRELAIAAWDGGIIRLHATPEAWFLGGQRGCCVLMWGAPLDDLFTGIGTVECDSPELHHRLVTALRRWEPRVVVRREMRRAS